MRLLARTSHAVIAADGAYLRVLGGPSPRHHQVPIGSNVPCKPSAGYDRELFRAQLGISADSLVVVYFGFQQPGKGLAVLHAAFGLIRQARPDAHLLMLGGDQGARLDERLLQSGWLTPETLSAYLLAADVALLPYKDGASARRGSLLACAEHALPMVTTLPATKEIARAVEAVESTPQALANAVLDPTLKARRQAPTQALAKAHAWPGIAQAHVEIYESLQTPP